MSCIGRRARNQPRFDSGSQFNMIDHRDRDSNVQPSVAIPQMNAQIAASLSPSNSSAHTIRSFSSSSCHRAGCRELLFSCSRSCGGRFVRKIQQPVPWKPVDWDALQEEYEANRPEGGYTPEKRRAVLPTGTGLSSGRSSITSSQES